VIDALLFEAPRYQGRAVDFAHAFLLVLQAQDYALMARPRKGFPLGLPMSDSRRLAATGEATRHAFTQRRVVERLNFVDLSQPRAIEEQPSTRELTAQRRHRFQMPFVVSGEAQHKMSGAGPCIPDSAIGGLLSAYDPKRTWTVRFCCDARS
jgi:hypothetical protein